MSAPRQVVVIGAGVSGVACALALQQGGMSVRVLEASAEPGGLIRSERRDGYLLELGPQSFTSTPELRALFTALQLDDQAVTAPPRATRYVLLGGRLRPVPLSPPAFFMSSLLGIRTKWSVVRDALGGTNPPEDESVAAFVRRKFTGELLERVVAPFVSGVYAGDPERLGLRSAFPQLFAAEQSAGSVVRGLLRRSRQQHSGRQAEAGKSALVALREGNAALIHALALALGGALTCKAEVNSVQRTPAGPYRVDFVADGKPESFFTDELVLAIPAGQAAVMLREFLPPAADRLASVEYAPVAVVASGYAKQQIGRPADGFGFLVSPGENVRLLGTVWNSFLFPGRAPEGHVLFTSFLGGVRDRAAASLPPTEMVAIVHQELARVHSISGEPAFSHVAVQRSAIPQYNLGHWRAVAEVEAAVASERHLHIAANYLEGPSVGACVSRANAVAAKILSRRPE